MKIDGCIQVFISSDVLYFLLSEVSYGKDNILRRGKIRYCK